MTTKPHADAAAESAAGPLEARGLSKTIRRNRIVDDVSIEVRSGEIVGLLGRNGAGKTTTFAMIVGLLKPDRGSIALDGRDLTEALVHKRALAGIAYLPQEASVFRGLTVRENLELVLEALGVDEDEIRERTLALLRQFGLEAVAERAAFYLSGGERRRCASGSGSRCRRRSWPRN